ncbi:DDE_Tnp_IS1595 domain-containing protein [Trichonephila clavata]|uniref:DDE_Tnp_IS1595 domain-containing protein n=1 Tax=Trichonephila clavata TaxID=2740835 RepID=A0A8X6LME0_TRICU|nr:DDE_Tnp_IS1595 domain-containing protein [Trichonephila clavata]
MIESSMKVGGSGVIVGIDESKFGKRKFHWGKRVQGKWVFGGVERETGACFMKVVADRTTDSLLSVINEYILPGSIIISDCWKSYDCLSNEGFVHLKVNHSVSFKDPDTGAHTNTIEGTWGAVKRGIPAIKAKCQLDYYLAEYVWRKKISTFATNSWRSTDSIICIYPSQTADKEPQEAAT